MSTDLLTTFSNQLADAVAAAAPAVVQVQGRRRPASGLVYADNVVLTTVRALGRDDGLHVRTDDGRTLDADLAGWDPTTGLAVLRVASLATKPIAPASSAPRVGHLALAVARSWSNVVTASAGVLSVIGGPLPTGRRQAIDQVYRISSKGLGNAVADVRQCPLARGFPEPAFTAAFELLEEVFRARRLGTRFFLRRTLSASRSQKTSNATHSRLRSAGMPYAFVV